MNSRRLVLALGVALLCSFLCTWAIGKRVNYAPGKRSRPLPTLSVVVAKRDLKEGDVLTLAALDTVATSQASSLPGLFVAPRQLAGRKLLVDVNAKEPITAHDVTHTDAQAGDIPDGMRAVLVPASALGAGDSPALEAGNHVDVLLTYRSEADKSFVTSVVLQNVTVLGDTVKSPDPHDARHIQAKTFQLLLLPEQAARFAAASATGKLTFARRNREDGATTAGLTHVSAATLETPIARTDVARVSAPKRATASAKSHAFSVEVIDGGKSSTQTFQDVTQ